MRQRKIKNIEERLKDFQDCMVKEFPVDTKELFPEDNPLYVEIGCGKGKFLCTIAKDNPDKNYIGIEGNESVALRALEKLKESGLKNAFVIPEILKEAELWFKEGSVSGIYLNFSDPWPKERHTKRRLTSPRFLARYDSIFKDKKHIIMKTDNIDLFNYSVESLKEYGYNINDISNDLHSYKDNIITTEYEDKFTSKGIKINYFDASKN